MAKQGLPDILIEPGYNFAGSSGCCLATSGKSGLTPAPKILGLLIEI